MSVSTVSLGEIIELSGREKVGARDVPIMSITMRDGLVDQAERFKKRIASTEISAYKHVAFNELVVGFPIDEGVLGFQRKYPGAAVSPAYDIWRLLDPSRVDISYLERYLRSPQAISAYQARMRGAVSRRRVLTKDDFREIRLPLPSVEEQRRVAAILDKADALRAKRREAIAKLDQLRQSVFIDMFGDPVQNPRRWQAVECSELCESGDDIKCGPFGTQLSQSEYREEGVPLWGIRHVNRDFLTPTVEFLSQEKAGVLSSYSIVSGDLVMTRKGTVGKCAIYPRDRPKGIMHSDLLRLRVDSTICNPVFLRDQFRYSPVVSRQVETMSSGAIMAGINVSKLKRLKVLLPDVDLQDKYAVVTEQEIGGLLRSFEKSREGLDHAFVSLQQKAFSGAL